MTTPAKRQAIIRALANPRRRECTARQLAELAGGKVTARDVRECCYRIEREGLVAVQEYDGKLYFNLTAAGIRYVLDSQAPKESTMTKHVAIYSRVSTKAQDTKSQEPDLERWANAQSSPVKWYRDKFTGKSMERPDWDKLEAAVRQGRVSAVVVWRIDRLGRTAKGLTALFDDLRERKVNLVSLKDGLDLSTPAGRLMANVLASVAQYETEVRGERVAAGQAKARADGKTWGGSKAGVSKKVTETQGRLIRDAKAKGESITAIAAAVGLSRPTIYSVLRATQPL